ncbi:biopolymer transport protein ExbD [Dysgonomonadaceae bacterium PH5-43]|nr:biopolymer transport protein ExbD [Dysgonomonadaceae bacterium PH5-43]
MSRFRKSAKREVPGLSTAALPDLIFTILFFFMIVTNMRPVSIKAEFELPEATEFEKLTEKNSIVYIMVGKQKDNLSVETIQLNSDFVSLEELPLALDSIKQIEDFDYEQAVVVLKADKDSQMHLIHNIKQHLRDAQLLTVHYSVNKK